MFSKTIITILMASTAVLAAPAPAPAIIDRQIAQSVTVCSDKGFVDCMDIPFNYGFCVQNVGRLNDKISSLKANGYNCIFYNDTGCRNGGGEIKTTGEVSDIRTSGSFSAMNDDVSSFLCNI
ncbi:hypothetical protein DL98DRAFT_654952 [Cadophora sp. DSE1049]|nr:hypothetical protein DL98DRAFT_654952 [Cadophora sp. DSE1049]